MSIKLYYDLLSQPSRALYIVLKSSGIPFEHCLVNLKKGEHYTEEYKTNVSRFGRVPVLHHNNFKLTESVAILRYLSRETNLSEKWYPKDSKKQALVDEFLEWQHNNVRAFCAMYFQMKWLIPKLTGTECEPERLAGYYNRMVQCLDSMEELWLTPGPFITGSELTAADLWAACEIEQPRMAGYDPTVGRPVLAAWLNRVKAEVGPIYQEAHKILNKIAESPKSSKL